MAKERRRLPLDQDVARSMGATSLQQIKKSTPETLDLFNSKVKIFYDRISKKVILGGEELCIKKRFISLSVSEATVLREFPKKTSGVKKRLTAADILILRKIISRKFDLEMIGDILRVLVERGVLESEEITIQDQIVEVFKIKEEA